MVESVRNNFQRKHGLIRFGRWLIFLLIGGVLLFFIWLAMPIEDFDSERLIIGESTAYVFLKLNLKDRGIKSLLNIVNDMYMRNSPAARAIPYLLPHKISAGIIYNIDNPKKHDYLVIADIGKRIRLLNIIGRVLPYFTIKNLTVEYAAYHGYRVMILGGKNLQEISLAVVYGKIVASNNIEFLKKALDNVAEGKNSFFEQPAINYLYRTASRYDGVVLVNNISSRLTRIVRDAEDKYHYSIFPSVDTVAAIAAGVDIVDEDRVEGEMVLSQYHSSESEVVGEDMRFFAGFFRRILRAYDIDIHGDVTIQDNNVRFFFKGEGFRALWEKILKGGFSHEKTSFNRTEHYLLAHTFCECG